MMSFNDLVGKILKMKGFDPDKLGAALEKELDKIHDTNDTNDADVIAEDYYQLIKSVLKIKEIKSVELNRDETSTVKVNGMEYNFDALVRHSDTENIERMMEIVSLFADGVSFDEVQNCLNRKLKPQYAPSSKSDIFVTDFNKELTERIKSVIGGWDEDGIYAISFFVYSNEAFEYNGFQNVSSFSISYNTEEDCPDAGPYDEERWNYAFWRQDENAVIDPDDPDSLIGRLFDWYKENNIRNIGYEDYENCCDADGNYIGKGPVGHYELISLVTDVAKQLREEGFIKDHFHKDIPIIIHGLEYAWYDIEATKKANPDGQVDDFLKAMKEIGVIE